MDQFPPLGTAIAGTVIPTMKICEPLLIANATAIKSTPRRTFSYGPHPRQTLDVYYPSTTPNNSPILIFLYGGGLVSGAKTLPNYAQGLVHANVGHFFAARLGYTTVIPDYRLLSHGAVFPSGGEDVALVVDWASHNLANAGSAMGDVFIMGNSAGGAHLCTFLFGEQFAETRDAVMRGSGARLRGVVMVSVPFHFEEALASRTKTLKTYFGDRIEEDCPLGLLTAARRRAEVDMWPGVGVFILNGSLDPEDEILRPRRDFLDEWERTASEATRRAVTVGVMKGQNHISPPLTLGSDRPNEEAWGYQVGSWIESIRKGLDRA